jgi:hypothetical protein
MVALKPGPENDAAAKTFAEEVEAEEKAAAVAAARAAKAKAKKGGVKGKGAAGDKEEGGVGKEEGAAENGAGENGTVSIVPPNTMFWRCCGCGFVQLANDSLGAGPADVIAAATKNLQQGLLFMQTKHPQLIPQAEESLSAVAQQMGGRLPPYNAKVLDALTPLINLNVRNSSSFRLYDMCRVDVTWVDNLAT